MNITLRIENGQFNGKSGWRTVKKILRRADKLGVNEIKWDGCKFTGMSLDYRRLTTDSQRAFVGWLSNEQHTTKKDNGVDNE